MIDQTGPLRGVDAVYDSALFVGVFDAVCAGVDGAGCVEDSTVDGFGTPDEVCAVAEGEETGGEFAYADHGGEDDFVAVVERRHFSEDASLCRRGSEEKTPEVSEIQDVLVALDNVQT